MSTFTAVPSAAGAAAVLTLTPSGTLAGPIMRTDANGTAPVRVPAGTFPRDRALTVTDWEAALGSPVTYSVAGITVRLILTGLDPVLVAVLRPSESVIVEAVTEYAAARASLGTVHQVQDRTDPLVSLGRLGARTGSLTVWFPDYPSARTAENMIDRTGVVMLKQAENPGQDMYFTAQTVQTDPDPESAGWVLTIAYTEISRPTSPITANAWTFADVSRSFPSFRNVTSSYSDFEMLTVNDSRAVL